MIFCNPETRFGLKLTRTKFIILDGTTYIEGVRKSRTPGPPKEKILYDGAQYFEHNL